MTECTLPTIAEFAANEGITMTAERTRASKREAADSWGRTAHHWACTFRKESRRWTIRFHMGSARPETPTLQEVLSCLAMDCSNIEHVNRDFESWCDEYGRDSEDEDELKETKRVFRACVEQADKAKAFLGDRAYEELLNETDHDA